VALFILTQLSNSVFLATTGLAIGSLAALLLVNIYDSPNWNQINKVFTFPFGIYVTAVFIGSLTNRNREMLRNESVETAQALGSNIAHELRTPLMGITSRASAGKSLLPILISGYKNSIQAGLEPRMLTTRQLELLETSFEDIQTEAQHANDVITMLLMKTSEEPLAGQRTDTFDANSGINNAIERYPFANKNERKLFTQIEGESFDICAPKILFTHIIFNLLKNSLYYLQQSGQGTISITTIRSIRKEDGNTIIFEDTGPGIPKIFDRFFTTTHSSQGTGIGLHFCKMVMEQIGGKIDCESKVSEFTKFTLTFPMSASCDSKNIELVKEPPRN